MTTLAAAPGPSQVWKDTPVQWALFALVGAALIVAFLPGLDIMVQQWNDVEEYSYGYFIPVIVAFLVWQKSDLLRQHELKGAWSGLLLIGLALLLRVIGEFSAIRIFIQYGFILALFGISACSVGWKGTRIIAIPLAFMVFMIPLPQFLLRELSQSLQLLSSQIGVWLIRLWGISVFLEGNVIDLGSYKLQVVEACSGLRYLFPLMALGALAAYFFKAEMWKRVLIVLSTIPLTILLNSLRIGLIGVTVEYWGSSMADGLLHDFEGWFMFMICIALLIGEMTLLSRIGPKRAPLRTTFGLEYPARIARDARIAYREVSRPVVLCALLLAGCAAASLLLRGGEQVQPDRRPFSDFPMQIGGQWEGRPDHLERDVLATLRVTDHLIANYTRGNGPWVNFYTAYYASQSGGESTHSPRTCIPGGGWNIVSLEETQLAMPAGVNATPRPLRLNRAVIQKGDQRQLVYFWFQQRGRTLTSELAVKWYILRDAITRHRSDGALVRLVTPVLPTETMDQAEQRLIAFAHLAEPQLPTYIPD